LQIAAKAAPPASSSRLGGWPALEGWLLAARAASTAASLQTNLQQPMHILIFIVFGKKGARQG